MKHQRHTVDATAARQVRSHYRDPSLPENAAKLFSAVRHAVMKTAIAIRDRIRTPRVGSFDFKDALRYLDRDTQWQGRCRGLADRACRPAFAPSFDQKSEAPLTHFGLVGEIGGGNSQNAVSLTHPLEAVDIATTGPLGLAPAS